MMHVCCETGVFLLGEGTQSQLIVEAFMEKATFMTISFLNAGRCLQGSLAAQVIVYATAAMRCASAGALPMMLMTTASRATRSLPASKQTRPRSCGLVQLPLSLVRTLIYHGVVSNILQLLASQSKHMGSSPVISFPDSCLPTF